jgi:hypothetical protein
MNKCMTSEVLMAFIFSEMMLYFGKRISTFWKNKLPPFSIQNTHNDRAEDCTECVTGYITYG